MTQQFGGDVCALVNDGWVAWSSCVQIDRSTNPDFALSGVVVPQWDGGDHAGDLQLDIRQGRKPLTAGDDEVKA